MLHYPDWLRKQLPNRPVRLILDRCGTHETDNFLTKSQHLGISLLWIPKGATGICQPLDRRVFGGLKAKGRAEWRIFYLEHNKPCDRAISAALLRASREELSESVVSAGWHFNERPLELDRDDSMDGDEFELTLDSDSEEWGAECLNLPPEEDL
jgi:hypothetical protein